MDLKLKKVLSHALMPKNFPHNTRHALSIFMMGCGAKRQGEAATPEKNEDRPPVKAYVGSD